MADREVSWKAVANFASLIAQSKKAQDSLKNLRQEEDKLATSFEADSARITAAAEAQNAAIANSGKSFNDVSASSSKATKDVVSDSNKRTQALENETRSTTNLADSERSAASTSSASSRERVNSNNAIIASMARMSSALKQSQQNQEALETATREASTADNQSVGVKKTLIQQLQNIQKLQTGYKGSLNSVIAAEQNYQRTLQKRLSAVNAVQSAQSSLSRAMSQEEAATQRVAAIEEEVAKARTDNAKASDDLRTLEQGIAEVRATSAAATSELEAAEEALATIRTHFPEESEAISSAENDVVRARLVSADAADKLEDAENDLVDTRNEVSRTSSVISGSEARISAARHDAVSAASAASRAETDLSTARGRAELAAAALVRAQTTLNGEMNASKSLINNVGLAFTSLSSIFSGTVDGFKDLIGMFGKMALTLLPQLIPIIGSLAGGFAALAGSIGPLTGLLGALPGLLVGAGTGFAALKLAFGGISGALKAYGTQQDSAAKSSTSAAKTALDNAKTIRNAQEALTAAKKSAADADKAAAQQVTKAEQSAAEANQEAAENVVKAEKSQAQAVKDAAQSIISAKQAAAKSVANANATVVAAEKNLTEAQQESATAQDALNNIRAKALQELEDMQKAARDASFSERDATLDLIDARNQLAAVKEDPGSSDLDVQKAQLAYDEAQARLSDAEEAKKKANEDNAEAQAKGIKGTQAYTDANAAAAAAAEKVADAQQTLIKAQKEQTAAVVNAAKSIAAAEASAASKRAAAAQSVADAQKKQSKTAADGAASVAAAKAAEAKTEQQGAASIAKAAQNLSDAQKQVALSTGSATTAANAYQQALAKLTPSQRAFVQFLVGLKPKLDELKKTASDNLLPGVEEGIKGALPLFPAFNTSVGNTAKALGDASSQIGKTLGSGEGFGAMQRVLKTNDDALKTASSSAGSYTIALTRIMDAARPLITWMGSLVAEFGQYLDKVTATNKQNGSMAKFFESARKEAELFGSIAKNLAGIIYGVTKAGKGLGDDLWGKLNKPLSDINKNVNSLSGQNKLKKWFSDIKPVLQAAGSVFANIGRSIAYLSGFGDKSSGGGLGNLVYMLQQLANGVGPNSPLIQFLSKLNKSDAQKNTFDALENLFKAVTNFANGGGSNVLGIMAKELDLVSTALGAIAGNKVGAAVLTTLMTIAATAKVAKFASAATGISGVAKLVKNSNQRRVASGKGSYLNTATGGRLGRSGTGTPTTAATSESASEAEAQGNTIGRDLDEGIAQGVQSNSTEVLRSIDAMTDGIINHIKSNLEIHSPSKVTEALGAQAAEGFAVGLRGETTAATSAAEALEAATIKSIEGTEARLRAAGEEAGTAYATGLRSTSSRATVAQTEPGVGAGKGAAVRGAIGGAGTAAFMGSMFLPGKAGQVAGDAGMALMMVSMLPKLETVTKVIESITSALKLEKAAEIASAAAAKVYAAAQWLVDAALDANPITLIIIGLVALGAAFYLLWTKSTTFRKIVTAAFDAVKASAVAVFDWFKKVGSTMFDWIKTGASAALDWVKKNWPYLLVLLVAPFAAVPLYLTVTFWPQIVGFLGKLWSWISGAFKKTWSGVKTVLMAPFDLVLSLVNQFTDSKSGVRKILSVLWSWVSGAFKKEWAGTKAIIMAPFDLAKTLINQFTDSKSGVRKILAVLWSWISGAFKKEWAGIQNIFWAPLKAAKALISQFTDSKSGVHHILSALWSWVSGSFRSAWNGIQSLMTRPISLAKSAISSALGSGGLQKIFKNALSGIKTIWNGLKSVVASPVNFMNTKVLKGLANAYNWIVGKIPGAGKLKIDTSSSVFQPIKMATGGRVAGNSPTPKADNIPAMLTAGEWVQPVSTVKHYGPSVMEAIRQRKIPKEALRHFATGGYVEEGNEDNKVLVANGIKKKKRKNVAYLRNGGEAGVAGYSLGSFGGAAELSSYYDASAKGHEKNTGDGVTNKGAAVPYRPGMLGTLNSYLRALQAKYGVAVLEHEPFGPVHRVHEPGSLHYVGMAADVSGGRGWPKTGNDIFNGALLKGLGAIWQSTGHYDHVHIDTGLYSIYKNVTKKLGAGVLAGGIVSGTSDSGNFITNTFSSLKALLGNLDPLTKLKSAITKPLETLGTDTAMGKMLGALAKAPLNAAVSALKDAFTGSDAYEGNATLDPKLKASLGVARWKSTVEKALRANGLAPTDVYVNAWLKQIQTESGGNPNAIQGNIGDINNKTGDLAKGLLQVISTTFAAYHFKGHDNIFNGYDNALAAIHYAKSRYGVRGMLNVIGHGHGYANGGHVAGYGNTDSVKAMLMPGEFVVRKEAAKRIGYDTLNQMNNIDRPGRATSYAGGGSSSGGVRHFATGGQVAPPDGQPIRNIKPGRKMMSWKMIRQLFGLKTVRGMKSPWQDDWGSDVTAAFTKDSYTVPDLSTITKAVDVSKYLAPVVSWFHSVQTKLPGKTQMEGYDTVGPTNYKQHPALTRLVQKIIGITQDSVWGSKMKTAYSTWRKDHALPMTSPTTHKAHDYVTGPDWKWLAEQYAPSSYGSPNRYTDKNYKGVRLEDISNKYGISMWQAAALFQGTNKDYIAKHTLAATSHLAQFDADNMTGASSWLNGNFIKSYQAMFGVHQDGVWATGMSDWLTYAMRKEMGKVTDTIFPPWWTLDALQQGIENQDQANKDQKEFLADLDILSGWGLGYLVDNLQDEGVDDGLPVARLAVKNKTLAEQYNQELETSSELNATGTADYTKFVAAVLAPGVQQGIRSLAQTLGIPDFTVVQMYQDLLKAGRLTAGTERTSLLDKQVAQFNKGLFYAATGGRVPGTGTGDTVPAMLTPGEFVLKKAAVKAIGMENLYNLNNVQKFATGGEVFPIDIAGRMNTASPLRLDTQSLQNAVENNTRTNQPYKSEGKTVNNYTTINNPRAEKSTVSINKLLRKKAALGFSAVDEDVTKVNG